jgi:hypothetical protein
MAAAWEGAMKLFEVTGSTLLYWKVEVAARDEDEAAVEAQRITVRADIPWSATQLGSRQNCVFECREIAVEDEEPVAAAEA